MPHKGPNSLISQWKRFVQPNIVAATSGPPIPLKTDAWVIILQILIITFPFRKDRHFSEMASVLKHVVACLVFAGDDALMEAAPCGTKYIF